MVLGVIAQVQFCIFIFSCDILKCRREVWIELETRELWSTDSSEWSTNPVECELSAGATPVRTLGESELII